MKNSPSVDALVKQPTPSTSDTYLPMTADPQLVYFLLFLIIRDLW